jgi:hypothetical protein
MAANDNVPGSISPEEMAMSTAERLELAARLRAEAEAARQHADALRPWWDARERSRPTAGPPRRRKSRKNNQTNDDDPFGLFRSLKHEAAMTKVLSIWRSKAQGTRAAAPSAPADDAARRGVDALIELLRGRHERIPIMVAGSIALSGCGGRSPSNPTIISYHQVGICKGYDTGKHAKTDEGYAVFKIDTVDNTKTSDIFDFDPLRLYVDQSTAEQKATTSNKLYSENRRFVPPDPRFGKAVGFNNPERTTIQGKEKRATVGGWGL